MKYRIKKVEDRDYTNTVTDTFFLIQEKFLFWWVNTKTKSCERDRKGLYTPIKLVVSFKDEQSCRDHLIEYFIYNKDVNYHGMRISKRYNQELDSPIFMNRTLLRYSLSTEYGVIQYYSGYRSLEDAQYAIDRMYKKSTKNNKTNERSNS